MDDQLETTTIPFSLRGVPGEIHVDYGVNEDPVRWGYDVLGPQFTPEAARGFPVIQASVQCARQGYAAEMAWIQIVRYTIHDTGEEETVFDAAPQMGDMEMPFMAFGVRPTMFDAPMTDAKDVTWDADTFLVHTPDAVLSRVIHATCGFKWGYRVVSHQISLVPVVVADESDWDRNLASLRARYPSWSFGTSWSNTTKREEP